MALGYWLDDRGFESRQGLGILLCTTVSRPALGPTQHLIQWVLGAISLGVKRPGSEADHSLPSNAEVKNAWSYTSTPPKTPLWHEAQLRKGSGNFRPTYNLPQCFPPRHFTYRTYLCVSFGSHNKQRFFFLNRDVACFLEGRNGVLYIIYISSTFKGLKLDCFLGECNIIILMSNLCPLTCLRAI
jgi:hypothetical protein